MLIKRDQSVLLLIDVQEKLTPYVLNTQQLVETCEWLLALAKELHVPILVNEQYPRGLGKTVGALAPYIQAPLLNEKVHFSCCQSNDFKSIWQKIERKQAILMGIETHVCVLQSALDLIAAGLEVFVVVDAVSSRKEIDMRYGLKRMKQAGVQLVTTEMVFFEWMHQAGTPEFKRLSQQFLQGK